MAEAIDKSAAAAPRPWLPRMVRVRQRFPVSPPVEIAAAVETGLAPFLRGVRPGARVAVAVGSRGITSLRAIVSAVVTELKRAGAAPFIVPAMGSHGGGTPAGQMALLAEYGVTEAALSVPFAPEMDVSRLGVTAEGFEVWFAAAALGAEHVVLVNRIKPHTDFSGTLGSGLLKMLVVGLGKRMGAASFHAAASRLGYEATIRASARLICAAVPVLCGVAVLEDQRHQTAGLTVLGPAEMEAGEAALCGQARTLMPRLPGADVDLLIVDRIGKNISGTGMDPAVIGRSVHGYSLVEPGVGGAPRVRRLFARDLSPETHGNGVGVGLADFATTRLVEGIDWPTTTLNALTALSLQAVKTPLHFRTDAEAIERALGTLGLADPAQARVVRIADTLSLEYFEMSVTALAGLAAGEGVEVLGAPAVMSFDEVGNLRPLDGAVTGGSPI